MDAKVGETKAEAKQLAAARRLIAEIAAALDLNASVSFGTAA
jgi:hypothetical protein